MESSKAQPAFESDPSWSSRIDGLKNPIHRIWIYSPKFNIDTKTWWFLKRICLLSITTILGIHVSFAGGEIP